MSEQIFLGASFKSAEEVMALLQTGYGAAVCSDNGGLSVLGPAHALTDLGKHNLACLLAGARAKGKQSPRIIEKTA